MSMLTQVRLKELLRYEPETGEFVRLTTISQHHAGSVAGNLSNGYRQIVVDGKHYYAHRLAWLYVYGQFPKEQLDHINRNKSDNRIANLRIATQNQNNINSKLHRDNKSGFRGVRETKRCRGWQAQIRHNGRSVYLGSFSTPEAAYAAYCEAAQRLHGEFFNPDQWNHKRDAA